jgi:hypothetical protein
MEQWRQELIDNPPRSAKIYSPEEWRDIVCNELIQHAPSKTQFKKGHKHSEEVKRKLAISQSKRKGKYFTMTKEKISKSNTGKKRSEESRKKMREAATGRVLDEKTKRKISRTLEGKKRSEDFKSKVSQAVKGRIHVTDGKTNRFVKPDQIPEGFRPGRTL